jgi:hypothetical protein
MQSNVRNDAIQNTLKGVICKSNVIIIKKSDLM